MADESPSPDPLEPVRRAIERGDLVEARERARALAEHADEAVRTKARGAVAQLGVDPVTVGVMLASGLVIVVLALLYLHAY